MPSKDTWKRYEMFIRAVEMKYTFGTEQMWAITKLMQHICEKAPSYAMGGSGVADEFYDFASHAICSERWCNNTGCDSYANGCIYNCEEEEMPSGCINWKLFRKRKRSYPEKKECRECKYYKDASQEEKGKYNCTCRKKVMPDYCPKKGR